MKPTRSPRPATASNAAGLRLVGGASAAHPAPGPEPNLAAEPVRANSVDELGGEKGTRSSRGRAMEALLSLPDARLVTLARTGDSSACEALYRRHATFAIHLATRIEGSTRDVEDVVHDAFIKAFTRLSDLADPQAFRSWLGSIVVHAVRSRLRRARLMSLLGLSKGADPIELDSIASSEASPHVLAQIAQVYALLRTLPTDDRIAWTLRYVEGHELDAAAKLADCSLATVKRRIARAQKYLQEHFIPLAVPPDGATTGAAESAVGSIASTSSPSSVPPASGSFSTDR